MGKKCTEGEVESRSGAAGSIASVVGAVAGVAQRGLLVAGAVTGVVSAVNKLGLVGAAASVARAFTPCQVKGFVTNLLGENAGNAAGRFASVVGAAAGVAQRGLVTAASYARVRGEKRH